MYKHLPLLVASVAPLGAALSAGLPQATSSVVNSTTCNGKTYDYLELAGYGFVPSDQYDKFGDTVGGIGSSIAFEPGSWVQNGTGYTGILWMLPDRGWNTQGTLNYQARIHKFFVTLTPQPNATVASPSGPNIVLTYLDSVLFTDPTGQPTTGLDGDPTGHSSFPSFPDLPIATYTGDGFGRDGPGGQRVPVDDEGLVVLADGSFWVSDEYGPYIYHYSPTGQMIEAIRPPDAYIPMRNGSESFSADSPTFYSGDSDDVSPADPDSGRENNHGLEALTVSPDGKTLYIMLQESLVQDGGTKGATENNVRMLVYDITLSPPALTAEYVISLPLYDSGGKNSTAGQSEMHYISDTQFLVLARDSGAGRGQDDSESLYRHADVFDISGATNIMTAVNDAANGTVAPKGVLADGITPATYCSWLDFNVDSQLGRFGVHNGGAQDGGLLNEKWESLALVPVGDGSWFLFSASDNDFITQAGRLDNGSYEYADKSGFSLDSQVLAFQVSLPDSATPL